MSHSEHPLVAAHRAHRAADLVGQGLECQSVVSCRQGAGDSVCRSFCPLHAKELVDGFFESTRQQMLETLIRDQISF